MNKLFSAVFVGFLGLAMPATAFAQAAGTTTEIVVPASLTVAQVTAQCGSVATQAECLAYVQAFVAQTKASGANIAGQRVALNSLVVGLAGVAAANPALTDLNGLISTAIETIATEAPEIVNADALNQIAEAVAAGDAETVTASIGALASPN